MQKIVFLLFLSIHVEQMAHVVSEHKQALLRHPPFHLLD